MDDVKKILENLRKTKENQLKAKENLANWAQQIGIQQETVSSEIDLWKDLEKQSNVPTPLTNSGNLVSQNLLSQSQELVKYIDLSKIPAALNSLGTTSVAASGIVMSAVTLSYPPDQYPKPYFYLERFNQQQTYQTDISSKIKALNPAIAVSYDNAWSYLYSGVIDPTRSSMFLMREVITQLLHHFSPDDKVKSHFSIPTGEKITRRQRVQYIGSLMDAVTRETFITQEQAILDVYDALNDAHKPAVLDLEKTKGYLYQANALIKLLLDSIPIIVK